METEKSLTIPVIGEMVSQWNYNNHKHPFKEVKKHQWGIGGALKLFLGVEANVNIGVEFE